MLLIKKKHLEFTVDIVPSTVIITSIITNVFTTSGFIETLTNAMTQIANICVRELNFADREGQLKQYFEGKGSVVK